MKTLLEFPKRGTWMKTMPGKVWRTLLQPLSRQQQGAMAGRAPDGMAWIPVGEFSSRVKRQDESKIERKKL